MTLQVTIAQLFKTIPGRLLEKTALTHGEEDDPGKNTELLEVRILFVSLRVI